MKRSSVFWIAVRLSTLVALLASSHDLSFAQNAPAFDAIMAAHGVKDTSPQSVLMTGMVQRGDGKPEPFQMLATADEHLRIDFGTPGKDVLVLGNKMSFHDDGQKLSYNNVPPGFGQLDITGLFFLEQLRARPVKAYAASDQPIFYGAKTQHIRVESERTELHKGTIKVADNVDVYVTEAGLLTAISRSFYKGRPEAYTQAFAFSDYRKTDGVQLPYQIDLYVKGLHKETFKIDQYQFDVPAEKSLFIGARAK